MSLGVKDLHHKSDQVRAKGFRLMADSDGDFDQYPLAGTSNAPVHVLVAATRITQGARDTEEAKMLG